MSEKVFALIKKCKASPRIPQHRTQNLGLVEGSVLPSSNERPLFDNKPAVVMAPTLSQLKNKFLLTSEKARLVEDDDEEFSSDSEAEEEQNGNHKNMRENKGSTSSSSGSLEQRRDSSCSHSPEEFSIRNMSIDSGDESYYSYNDENPIVTSTANALNDLKMLVGEISSETKLKILTRLIDDVTQEAGKELAIEICKAKNARNSEIDIFDAFSEILRRMRRYPDEPVHQTCVEKYLELFCIVVEKSDKEYESYIGKRVLDIDLIDKLLGVCLDQRCQDWLSEEQCFKINERLTNCARNGTLIGFFSRPREQSLENYYDAFERSIGLPVKVPPGLLMNGSEFYARVNLGIYETQHLVNLTELIRDVVDTSQSCDDVTQEGDTCDIGYVKVFANGFALISKTSRKSFDCERSKFTSICDTTTNEEELNSFKLGQQVYIPERHARGVLLKVEPGEPQGVKKYIVYLMDEGAIFKTEKIVEIPKNLPSKPLLFFARVDGLFKDNLCLKNLAAKALITTLRDESIGQLLLTRSDLESLLSELFDTGKKYLQLFSLRCLKYLWIRRHNETIERRTRIYNPNITLCRKISRLLISHPSCEDAVEVLYHMLNIINQDYLKRIFEETNLPKVLRQIAESSPSQQHSASKLLSLSVHGNYWIKKERRSRIQEKPRSVVVESAPVIVKPRNGRSNGSRCIERRRAPERPSYSHVAPKYITKSFAEIANDPIVTSCLQDLYQDGDKTYEIVDRTQELQNEVIRNYSNPVKSGTRIPTAPDFDDVYLEEIPDSHTLGMHIVAHLNADKSGRIFIGVRASAVIQGVFMDRRKKDLFRLDFDHSLKNNVTPKLSIMPDKKPVGYPEFHPVEDGRSDIYIIKVVINPDLRKTRDYRWGKTVYKRVNGETRLLKSN